MTSPSVRLLNHPDSADCAAPTFDAVLAAFANAQSTVDVHMFVWRSDDVGNAVAQAVLDAADRGVRIRIRKDVGAFMYERIEMNRQSLFDLPIPRRQRLFYRLIRPTFPDTYAPDDRDGSLGAAILAHPNCSVEWVNHTHSKYYLFDDETLLTGSINLEDRHRRYFDHMIEIQGADLMSRFRARLTQQITPDPSQPVEFFTNCIHADGARAFEIKPRLLALIAAAQRSVYVEMAYLGDPDVSQALADAANNGVAVTILTSQEANVGNDLNYRTLHRLAAAAPAIRIFLSPTMIHTKTTIVDDRIAFLGSANASVFSMQQAVELNVQIQHHPKFLAELRHLSDARITQATPIPSPDHLPPYRAWLAVLQQFHQRPNRKAHSA